MDINEQVRNLAEILKEYDLSSVEVETEEISVKLKKEKNQVAPVASLGLVNAAETSKTSDMASTAPETAIKAPETTSGKCIKAPLVGTFYAAPGEGKAPYVKVGDTVKKGQIIGIIEAMKLMNEIESDQDGVVKAVLVQNGKLVEYGQPLVELK